MEYSVQVDFRKCVFISMENIDVDRIYLVTASIVTCEWYN